MKKIATAFAIVAGLGIAGLGVSSAKAQGGVHLRAGGLHLDLGNVHRGNRGYGVPAYQGRQRVASPYAGQRFDRFSRGRGHFDYHDTTHLDWHPGSYRRHGNHYDYVPGHYDVHRTGHFDYHRGGHGRLGY